MKPIWPLLLLLLQLLSCAQPPELLIETFSIELEHDGGMQNNFWTISLSKQEAYLSTHIQGREDRYNFSLSDAELFELYQFLHANQFADIQINTADGPVYDRGGTAITVRLAHELIRKNNSGSDFIHENQLDQFRIIEAGIYDLVERKLAEQKLVLEEVLHPQPAKTSVPVVHTKVVDPPSSKTPFALSGPASLHLQMEGRQVGELADETIVYLEEVKHNWARIRYQHEQWYEAWILLKHLATPGFLINEQAIGTIQSSWLGIQLEKHGGVGPTDTQTVTVTHNSSTNQELTALWYEEIYPSLTNEPLRVALAYTGIEEFPFLLYLSNQTGDEISSSGALILYHPDKEARHFIRLDDGNRVGSQLLSLSDGELLVKEAFYCQIPLTTRFTFDAAGIQRESGTFAEGAIFPNPADFTSDEENERSTPLSRDITVFHDSELVHDRSDFFVMGASLSFELLAVDYTAGLVRLRVNAEGDPGWMIIDTVKELEAIAGMHGGGCSAG